MKVFHSHAWAMLLTVCACARSVDSDVADVGDPGLVDPVWAIGMPNTYEQLVCPALIDGDIVIGSDGGVARLDADDGTTMWWVPFEEEAHYGITGAVAALAAAGDGLYAVTRFDTETLVVNAEGDSWGRWLAPEAKGMDEPEVRGMAIAGSHLWVEFYNRLDLFVAMAFDAATLSKVPEIAVRSATTDGSRDWGLFPQLDGLLVVGGYPEGSSFIDPRSGAVKWEAAAGVVHWPGECAPNGLCISGGDIVAFATGEVVWSFQEPFRIVTAAVTDIGFLFLVTGPDTGQMWISARNIEGVELFRTSVGRWPWQAVDGVSAPDGRVVYFPHLDGYYAFDARDGSMIAAYHVTSPISKFGVFATGCRPLLTGAGVVQQTSFGVMTLPYPPGVGPGGFLDER